MACIYHQPFKVRFINKDFKEFIPYAPVSPSAKSSVGILPVPVVGRKITPRCACPQDPENSVDELPVVSGIASPGAFAAREMIFQKMPNAIRNIVTMIRIRHVTSFFIKDKRSFYKLKEFSINIYFFTYILVSYVQLFSSLRNYKQCVFRSVLPYLRRNL